MIPTLKPCSVWEPALTHDLYRDYNHPALKRAKHLMETKILIFSGRATTNRFRRGEPPDSRPFAGWLFAFG